VSTPGREVVAYIDATERREQLRAEAEQILQTEVRTGPVAEALSPSRVDLVALIRSGIPEPAYVRGCEGWLRKGKRYLIFAPAGNVKSLGILVVCVGIVEAGGRVSILDLENGADEYARRLEAIIDGDEARADACAQRLRYFQAPTLALDWREADWAAAFAGDDAVVIDSSRVALSSVGLSEDLNDDYSRFISRLITPLSWAGTTTVVLDNSGHEGGHPRGASAKSDLNEVVFEFRVTRHCDTDETGEVVWQRRRTRFGGIPATLTQRLGGGVYELPRPSEREVEDKFRPTLLMERVSRYVEEHPGCSQRAVREAGLGKREATAIYALGVLRDEGYVVNRGSESSHAYHSQIPYREEENGALLATPEEEQRAERLLGREGDQ
jgi:AAA domain